MVESSITQASPISAQPTPREVVASFLRLTVDTPDLQKARLHLTRRSVEAGDFHAGAVPAGSTYTLGAEEADDLGRRIPVSVKSPGVGDAAAQEMTVPMIVVEEEGQWKIDLPATMERLMGGMGEAMDKVTGAMGEALTTAMSGVSAALTEGLGGAEAAATTVARKAVTIEKVVKKAMKKIVKRAVKKTVKKVAGKKVKKAAPKAGKAAGKKPAKKAARKTSKKAAKKPGKRRHN
jgi:hypothetical protein